jgi:hypothetical protein
LMMIRRIVIESSTTRNFMERRSGGVKAAI